MIIPNFNGRKYLEDCLGSLLDQSYDNYSVLVVDNASEDGSVAFIRERFPQVQVVESKINTGYAGGCNLGLRRELLSDSKYFILVNNDTRADRHWLAELVKAPEANADIGLCQSMIYLADQPSVINTAGNQSHFLGFGYSGHYLEEDHGQFRHVIDIPFASGTAMLIRRDVLESVGLMDEDLFLYQEDLDLSWRARLSGWRVALAPDSKIFHDYSFSRNSEKFYYLERNRLVVSFKNYGTRSLVVLAPAYLAAEVAMLGYALAAGWPRQKLQGYRYLFENLGRLRQKRRLVQQQRRLGDAEVVAFWSDTISFADLRDSSLARVAHPLSRLYWRVARRLL